jgi:hypothetical protein
MDNKFIFDILFKYFSPFKYEDHIFTIIHNDIRYSIDCSSSDGYIVTPLWEVSGNYVKKLNLANSKIPADKLESVVKLLHEKLSLGVTDILELSKCLDM